MAAAEKVALRRAVRAAFPGAERREEESAALCGHILRSRWYHEADVIGAYWPMRREADVIPVLMDAIARGKNLTLPLIEGPHRMSFRHVPALDALKPGAYGLLEPEHGLDVIAPDALALMIVPVEAMDRRGFRLGKGGGYYDAYLQSVRCPTVGAVMSWQWRERIPTEPWDLPLTAAADALGMNIFELDTRKGMEYREQEEAIHEAFRREAELPDR